MSGTVDTSVTTARSYYNSSPADNFYYTIWGGNDIHIGLYALDKEPIAIASQRTVEKMAQTVGNIDSNTRVLDLGAGYGGAARWLAQRHGCKVTCLNLSEVQNERNRSMTREAKLGELVEVVDGDFENLPFGNAAFDLIWSQDSFLHCSNRETVIKEIARVLIPKRGTVVFTDPMASRNASQERLGPIKQRLSIDTFGSQTYYKEQFAKHGFTEISFDSHLDQLILHYTRVLEEIDSQKELLEKNISDDYVERVRSGLKHWIRGGKEGQLDWGIHLFFR